MTRIVPTLWYQSDALEAARFYAAHLPESRIDRISDLPADSPSGPAGSVQLVEFTLAGTPFLAFTAAGPDRFNYAVSLTLECADQAQIDRLWQVLSEGGTTHECGWLRDRWGLFWQIVPRGLQDMIADPDRAAAGRAATAMLGMRKLDAAALRRAFDGATPPPPAV